MRGVKPRNSCFAASTLLHASSNVQTVIHHLATNRETASNSKKIQQLFRKEQRTMQGTNAKKGRYKTRTGSTLSHIEKAISFIMW